MVVVTLVLGTGVVVSDSDSHGSVFSQVEVLTSVVGTGVVVISEVVGIVIVEDSVVLVSLKQSVSISVVVSWSSCSHSPAATTERHPATAVMKAALNFILILLELYLSLA